MVAPGRERPVRERAERIILGGAVFGRLGALFQLGVAVTEAVSLSPHPALAAGVGGLAAAEMAGVCTYALITSRYLPPWWIRADVLLFIGAVVAQHWITAPQYLTGSWVGWATGALMPAVWAAACYLPMIELAVVIGSSTIIVLVVSLPAIPFGGAPGISVSASVMAGLPVLFRLVAGYIRRVALEADEQLALVQETARRAELDAHRLLVHDSASILRLVADQDLEPTLRVMLRAQADAEATRISTFLADPQSPSLSPSRSSAPSSARPSPRADDVPLRSAVMAALVGFGELPLHLDIDRTSDVDLPTPAAVALERALTAVLHNVRLHAQATRVEVSTMVMRSGWSLVLSDDGRGFSAAGRRPGFGLRAQVAGSLHEHGIAVALHSAPGSGTTVLLVAQRSADDPVQVGR